MFGPRLQRIGFEKFPVIHAEGNVMAQPISRKPRISVYTEEHRTFIRAPSQQVQTIRQLLHTHGLGCHYPRPVMMGYHSIELIDDVDLDGLRALLDEWGAGG